MHGLGTTGAMQKFTSFLYPRNLMMLSSSMLRFFACILIACILYPIADCHVGTANDQGVYDSTASRYHHIFDPLYSLASGIRIHPNGSNHSN